MPAMAFARVDGTLPVDYLDEGRTVFVTKLLDDGSVRACFAWPESMHQLRKSSLIAHA